MGIASGVIGTILRSPPETTGLKAAATATVAVQATGMGVSGLVDVAYPATGDQGLKKASERVETLTNPAGMTGVLLSGGNFEIGNAAAAAYDATRATVDLTELGNTPNVLSAGFVSGIYDVANDTGDFLKDVLNLTSPPEQDKTIQIPFSPDSPSAKPNDDKTE
jgi:hypothetical protein